MMITYKKYEDFNGCEVTVNLKKTFIINKWSSGDIQVCMQNAMHAAWRGSGKMFSSFEEAIKAYKSQAAKEAIKYAKEILK